MSNFLSLLLAVLAGLLLGAIFFGGLWWTVRKGMTSAHPALLFFSSMLLRMSIVLLGFYFILGDNWLRLLAGLCGFFVARLFVIRLTRVTLQPFELTQETRHHAP
ncbi:MAG: ATP synthase subunit I [Gallionellaceae bacterium]|jgi:F1F0 ATPase subunit 2